MTKITEDQIIDFWRNEIAQFEPVFQEFYALYPDTDEMKCVVIGEFSTATREYLIEYPNDEKQADLLTQIFSALEYIIQNGDDQTRLLMKICFLENLLDPHEAYYAVMQPFLGQESAKFLSELYDFWYTPKE